MMTVSVMEKGANRLNTLSYTARTIKQRIILIVLRIIIYIKEI